MTTVVLTPDYILADCRLTSTIHVKDEAGNAVTLRGTTDDYCKIGDLNLREPNDGGDIEPYVTFGDVELARSMVQLVKATTFNNIDAVLSAFSRFKIEMPSVPTGFAWVSEAGIAGYLIFENGGYRLMRVPEGTAVVTLGSGRELFYEHFNTHRDIETAFYHALANDPHSSDRVYDQWDRETGVVSRTQLPDGIVQTLEELVSSTS
jgi:hypothetical protein